MQHSKDNADTPNPPRQDDGGGLSNPVSYFTSAYDKAGQVDATRMRAAILNPEHTQVSKGAKKTPLEVQLGLTLLPVRYLPRAIFKSATDSAAPNFMYKITGINWIRDNIYLPGYLKSINARLDAFEPHAERLFPGGTRSLSSQELLEKVEASDVGKELIADIKNLQTRWDAGDLANNTVEYYLRKRGPDYKGITPQSKSRLRGKMSDTLFELAFDNVIGLGSLWYTRSVQRGVHNDIMSIYSEAVSYENGKRPEDQHDPDIAGSSNEIIQSTVKNYRTMRALRYGISAMPFLKNIPSLRALQWGEATVASWGILWARDIMVRQPTMMENFRAFVNDKLNPLYGIGDPIKSAEIIDLYQQYAYRFHPDIAFRSISVNDEDANRMWAQSEKIFGRIAQLMNESYNFKHTTEIDPETNAPRVKADFTLPKFIYLLGHGLINARKPEWSMAFIELANQSKDMQAVKEAAQAMRQNVSLGEIVEKYGINLNPTGHVNGISGELDFGKSAPASVKTPKAEAISKDAPAETIAENHPKPQIDAATLDAANLNKEPATPARASA